MSLPDPEMVNCPPQYKALPGRPTLPTSALVNSDGSTSSTVALTSVEGRPSLPAFVSSNVLNVLVSKFNIKPVTTAKEDLAAILGGVKS